MSKEKLTSSALSQRLWQMSNALRGNLDGNEFKDYILGLLFYRFLSDKSIQTAKEMFPEQEDSSYEELFLVDKDFMKESIVEKLGCVVYPEWTFESMMEKVKDETFTTEDLQLAFDSIIETSKENASAAAAYNGLLSGTVDLNSSRLGRDVKSRSRIIADILKEINKIYSDYETTDFDILGTAYEILIGLYAASAGKKGGEFYTPDCMQKLVCKIASNGFETVENACDPSCGSASMLIKLGQFVKVRHFYGTELNSVTEQLARMNMILHGIEFDCFTIRQGNTLETPDLAGHEEYQIVVANPPYSANWDQSKAMEDPRFAPYGKPAPKSKADFAFVEHIAYHLADNGHAAILLPHGVLFRGAAEKIIREKMLRDNLIDAIIGLPENCFYGTSIPVCCIVLKKNRKADDRICFIDASKYFTKNKNMNSITDEDIDRIMNAYTGKTDIDKFCHMVDIKEIEENDFNLNIPRYVDTYEPEPEIDLNAVIAEIKKTDNEIKELNKILKKDFDALGLEYPFEVEDK